MHFSIQSALSWAGTLPRHFELYEASAWQEPGNWFQHPNTWRALVEASPANVMREAQLGELDEVSWSIFKKRAAPEVHRRDSWGYSRPLFDCFNELLGYQHLKRQGYEDVCFVAPRQDAKTPDIRARSGAQSVLLEVKTVNESDQQKNYFTRPTMCVDVERRLPEGFKAKLLSTIQTARDQLLANSDPAITSRIVYLVIRPDFWVEAEDDLSAFLAAQSTHDVDILHALLG